MQIAYFHFHIFRSNGFEIFLEQFSNFIVFLIGNQTATDFCMGHRRQYCFCPFSGITSPNTTYIECGTNTGSLVGRESFFAMYGFYTLRFLVSFQIKRSFGHFGPLICTDFQYVVIKSGNSDMSFVIDHISDHLTQYIDRICHSTSENTGM